MRRRFIARTIAHLREVFPAATGNHGPPVLRTLVEEGMTRAGAYQLTGQWEITLFIDLLVGLGGNFDQRPEYLWLRRILENPELAQREKAELICKKLENSEAARAPAAGLREDTA